MDETDSSRTMVISNTCSNPSTSNNGGGSSSNNNNGSSSIVAQVTLVPATQTTVVTTTTTTTTSLPPFVLKAPKNLRDRDPETYPLAASPTPPSIKRLKLDIGGHTTFIEEAEESEEHLHKFVDIQNNLRSNGGFVQTSETITQPNFAFPSPLSSSTSSALASLSSLHARTRSATPISTPDGAELNSFHRRNLRTKLATPGSHRRHPLRNGHSFPVQSSSGESEPEDDSLGLQSHSPSFKPSSTSRRAISSRRSDSVGGLQSPAELDVNTGQSIDSNSSFAESDIEPFASMKAPEARRHVLPSSIDTNSIQDASLPSPSLSPIRASAHLHRARHLPLPDDNDSDYLDAHEHPQPLSTSSSDTLPDLLTPNESVQHATFADIPNLVETFDHLPDKLKSYVMYQLLRRCAKPTILFVRNAIDPALRCDFLARLPLELSFQILDHLDAKSLCRAAQVSRKWRSIVDSNERAWMRLISADGFQLPQGEVERAVRDGWGWRYLNSLGEWEEETRRAGSIESGKDVLRSLPESASDPSNATSTSSPKRKRKSGIKASSSKRQKRRSATSSQNEVRSESWLNSFEAAQGPNAFAQAAAIAVPDPKIGIPSLRNLHLFKSIYQRHHLIRRSWMDPKAKPLHHAFRAHQRHVVTCLQFDSDKILTGSDDSNIDVYDTKTGASLSRLTGHDGGVWALEYQGDLLVSGSTDRTVRVWDMKNGRALHVFQGHTSTVRCLQILKPTKVGETPDGKAIMQPEEPLIITGSRDSTCRIWKLPKLGDRSVEQVTGNVNDHDNPYFVRVLSGHSNSVRAIAAHADTLVSGSYDSTVRVWKVSTGELVHRLQGHNSKVYSVVLDYPRGRCISGSMDTFVKIWSLATGNCLYNLEGHTSLVGLLDLRDGVLVSAAADATLRIWEPEDGSCRSTLTAHTGAITCFSHDGQKIISGSDRTLKMWNTQTGECVRDLLSDLGGVWQIKFDQRRCVAAVQRNNWTYIEVLDFGAARDGIPESKRGRRIVVDSRGEEIAEDDDVMDHQVVEVNGP